MNVRCNNGMSSLSNLSKLRMLTYAHGERGSERASLIQLRRAIYRYNEDVGPLEGTHVVTTEVAALESVDSNPVHSSALVAPRADAARGNRAVRRNVNHMASRQARQCDTDISNTVPRAVSLSSSREAFGSHEC